jgi:hypothetical protein
LASLPGLAQRTVATPGEGNPWKPVELKHLAVDPIRLVRVNELVRRLAPQVEIYSDPALKVFMIRGPDDQVTVAEQVLRRFDVSPERQQPLRHRQMQVTIHLVEGIRDSAGNTGLPAELKSAIAQLTNTFGYKSVRLVDTILLQGREESESSLSGLLPMAGTGTSEKLFYTARYMKARYSEPEKTVSLYGFRFEIRIPVPSAAGGAFGESAVQTDLVIREGQKLVLGKLTKDQSDDRGLFLVVTAKTE